MKKGYTVIELLTVIVIISILAAMLFHTTQKAKRAAQIAECHNYRRQMTIYYYADTIDESNESRTSYLDLILDHKVVQDKCYNCHAGKP